MTRYAPLWQQAQNYPATLDRQLVAALWPTGGVTSGGTVTTVTNAMQTSVAAGAAVVPLQTGQGSALCVWDAAELVTHAAAPPSGSTRIDLVTVQVRDNALDGGANNDFVIGAVTGTSAVSNPAVPATPPNALALAQVLVPGAAANLNAATITRAVRLVGTDPAWLNVTTFQNGWLANSAADGPQYRRIGGLVYLRGGIKTGTTGTTAFTLPSSYRPSITMHFAVRVSTGAVAGNLRIMADGTVQPSASTAGWDTQFTSISGVCFDPDGS